MFLNGEWYSEPELKNYIQQLEKQIESLQEQVKNQNSKKGEV